MGTGLTVALTVSPFVLIFCVCAWFNWRDLRLMWSIPLHRLRRRLLCGNGHHSWADAREQGNGVYTMYKAENKDLSGRVLSSKHVFWTHCTRCSATNAFHTYAHNKE